MSEDEGQQDEVIEYFAGFIPITAAGKSRARRKMEEARARRTPESLNAMRAQVGLPPFDRPRRYPRPMGHDTDPQNVTEAPAAPVVTEQGKARVRETLAAAKARRDPAMLAALREKFGHRTNRLA